MRIQTHLVLTLAFVAAGNMPALAAEDAELMKSAMSAAPEAVAKNATIIKFDEKGQMATLMKGTNGFTCLPDDKSTPGNDPICLDQYGMLWVQALMTKTEPPDGKPGIAYMLQGGSTASNTDPFATKPADGKWQSDGPHMMVFNSKALAEVYPQTGENPDTTQPYVMFPRTPYAHLMIPVKQ